MYPPRPAPPPKVDARLLRPRRYWYAVAVAPLVVCGVIAGLLFPWAFDNVTDIGRGFHDLEGGQTKVSLSVGGDSTLYASEPVSHAAVTKACTVTGPGKTRLVPVTGDTKVTQNSEWVAVAQLRVRTSGEYTVSCESEDGKRYTVGPSVAELSGRTGEAVGAALLFFLLLGGGFVAGLTTFLVTVLRRNAHRKRLRAGFTPRPW